MVIRKVPSEKQRIEGEEGVSIVWISGSVSSSRNSREPWSGSLCGMLEEQQQGQGVWSGMSKVRSGRSLNWRGDGRTQ